MSDKKQGLMNVASKRSSNTVDVMFLRMSPENERKDYDGIPLETAYKLCDPNIEFTAEELRSIKAIVESGSLSNDKSLHWLVKSIAENGVLDEMSGYYVDGLVYANSGNRRTLAVWINRRIYNVNIEGVPLKSVAQFANEGDMMTARWLENKGRNDLNPYDEAVALKKMVDYFSGDVAAVCKKLTLENWKALQILSVLSTTPEAQSIIESGDVARRALVAVQKEVAQITNDPIKASQITSTAIIEAKAANKGENKGRITEADMKAKLPKVTNLDKESLLSELHELLSMDAVVDALDADCINKIVKTIKKKTES